VLWKAIVNYGRFAAKIERVKSEGNGAECSKVDEQMFTMKIEVVGRL
jgi:hypothetical protein